MSIVQAWLSNLQLALPAEALVAAELRIGPFYTAVRLSSGDTGLAFTTRELGATVCCPKTAAAAPPAGCMVGEDAWALAEYALSPAPLRRSVGVATLNALSARAVRLCGTPRARMIEALDALEAAEVRAGEAVTMVGAFTPFIKKLKGKVAALSIIDKHRDALKHDELAMWVPPEDANAALARADVVLVSGSALVEGGLDELLSAARKARVKILAGPTAPIWPPPFFDAGIDVLAGVRVLDAARVLAVVSQGGSGYYFFDEIARKVCMVKESR